MRRATKRLRLNLIPFTFQSTLSVRRATEYADYIKGVDAISIHALREESDLSILWYNINYRGFQSTLSVRRATCKVCGKQWNVSISIHALREESDRTFGWFDGVQRRFQSTLSVRRATKSFLTLNTTGIKFQSTLSVRRATAKPSKSNNKWKISIHALREESDHPHK